MKMRVDLEKRSGVLKEWC